MAKGHRRNGTTVGAGPKTRKRSPKENAKREHENATSMSAGLKWRAKKEKARKEHENATTISAGL